MAKIEKTVEVAVPLRVAYNQWTQFEEFPRFMDGVKEVRQIDDAHLHWRAEIAGKEKEWTAEIVEQIPDRRVSWRSTSGAHNMGTVSFEAIPAGTRITLWMEYDPEGFLENVGDVFGAISRRMEGDLQRFREFIESRGRETGRWRGEIERGKVHRPPHGGADVGPAAAAMASSHVPAPPTVAATTPLSGESVGAAERAAALGPSGSGAITPEPPTTDPAYWRGERDRRREERRRPTGALASPSRSGISRRRHEPRFLRSAGSAGDPFAALQRMAEDMDELFGQMVGRSYLDRTTLFQGGMPEVEVYQRGEELHVDADVPGIKREDLKLEVQDGILTIEADRRLDETEEHEGRHRSRRSHEHFSRTIALPEGAEVERASATLHDGVLRVVIPLPARAAARRIELQEPHAALPRAQGASS